MIAAKHLQTKRKEFDELAFPKKSISAQMQMVKVQAPTKEDGDDEEEEEEEDDENRNDSIKDILEKIANCKESECKPISAKKEFMTLSTGDDVVDSLLIKMSHHMTI